MTCEWCDVPFKVLDVRVQGDGGIGDDFTVVQMSRASLGNLGFGNAVFEHEFLISGFGVLAAVDR